MGKSSIANIDAFKANPDDKRHGTRTGYMYGCKCERCLEAGRTYAREAYRRKCERQLEKAREAREREKDRAARARKQQPEKRKLPKDCCTVNELYKPLMGKPSLSNANGTCCWCGSPGATNRHHIVKRSAGRWVKDGREVSKPTVLLCGNGNASGCHGKAHRGLLHFRWNDGAKANKEPLHWYDGGHWEGLEVDEPVKYQDALGMEGWRRL